MIPVTYEPMEGVLVVAAYVTRFRFEFGFDKD
jgi:hypothetical protein